MFAKIIETAPFAYFILLPCLFWPSFTDPYELPKAIFFIISIYFYIGLYILRILASSSYFVKSRPAKINWLFILLILILTLGSLLNGFQQASIFGEYYRYQGLFTYYCYFLFFLLFSHLLKTPAGKILVTRCIAIGGLLQSLLIIGQGILVFLFHLPLYTYNGRLPGFFGNPNFAAYFLILSSPFLLLHSQSSRKFYLSKPLNRLAIQPFFFFLIIFFFALLLTGSRSALLAFFLLCVIFFFLKFNRFSIRLRALSGLFLIILVISLFFVNYKRGFSSFENQPLIWQKSFQAILQKPLLGYGVENYETAFKSVLTPSDFDLKKIRVDKAHNELLEIAVGGGLISLSIYLVLVFSALYLLWKKRSDPFNRACLLMLGSFLLLSQFNVLNLTSYLFFYLALSVAAQNPNSDY